MRTALKLARGDREADQISGLESVHIGTLLHFPIESALDTAKPQGHTPEAFCLVRVLPTPAFGR